MSATSDPQRRGPAPWHPLAPECPMPGPSLYRDGCYLVSDAGECATWAVCDRGRWGVVYECNGDQVLSSWVHEENIPLHVLAAALPESAR